MLKYISNLFPYLSKAKIEDSIFTGPNVRKILHSQEFEEKMTSKEPNACMSVKEVVEYCLGHNIAKVGTTNR